MKYAKPEVVQLGDAARLIEQTGVKWTTRAVDPLTVRLYMFFPSYDLDE